MLKSKLIIHSILFLYFEAHFGEKLNRKTSLISRLGLKSFEKDVSGAVMDIQADEDEGLRQAKTIKKWYIMTILFSIKF